MGHNLFNYVQSFTFLTKFYCHNVTDAASFWISKHVPKSPYTEQEENVSIHLPSLLLLPPSPRRPHSTGKSFRAQLWFKSQLYLLWVKWFWASDVSSFHSFPRAELSIGMEKQVESIYWISQLSACSPASSIYPKVLLRKRY